MRLIVLALAALLAVLACERKSGAPTSPTSLVAADLAADSPLEKPFRLKDGEELDVDRLFALLPPDLRPTYDAAAYDATLGATVVTNLRLRPSGQRAFSAERAEFYGVDIEKIERLNAERDASRDAPLERVAEKMRLYGVETGSATERTTRIGAVEIDHLRVRPAGAPKAATSGLARFFNAFDVAGVYFKDVRSAAQPDFELTAPDLRLVGLGGGRLNALLAKDLEYRVGRSLARGGRSLGPAAEIFISGPLRNFIAPEDQRVGVARLEWRGISFAGLMEYGLRGEPPPITAKNLVDLGTARLVDAETFIGDRRFSLVPETVVSAMDFDWLAPSKVRAVTRGGLYDFTAYVPDTEKEALAALKARRLDRVKGDSDLAYDWSAEDGDAVFSAGFDSAGFADFDLDIALSGLELKKIADSRAAGAARPAADLGSLRSFSMTIADEQMLDAFYALSALESGRSEKEIRAAAPTLLRLSMVELERDNPRVAGYLGAVADFLEEGGALEIRAEPETPVPLKAIAATTAGGPDAIATAINLTVVRRK